MTIKEMKDMQTKHAHKHDHCKHERLKFCSQCNVPHCLDCGYEWKSVTYTVAPNTSPFYSAPFWNSGTATLTCSDVVPPANATSGYSQVLASSNCLHTQ